MRPSNKPVVFKEAKKVRNFLKHKKEVAFKDLFPEHLKELFFVKSPRNKFKTSWKEQFKKFKRENKDKCTWIFFPNKNILIRTLCEDDFFTVRTSRNREIITTEEQTRYRALNVAIAGLSVGSAAAFALVHTGGPKSIQLADMDTLSLSNLNRIAAHVSDCGRLKTDVLADALWGIDPFLELASWKEGVKTENLREFLTGNGRVDFFIDEMDDIKLKVKAREQCRKLSIPVIMATDNGEDVILDIVRFDLSRNEESFPEKYGLEKITARGKSKQYWKEQVARIINPNFMTKRHITSFNCIGESLEGAPQLGTTAFISGAVVAHAIRSITRNKRSLPTGRYIVSVEKLKKTTMLKKNNHAIDIKAFCSPKKVW